MKRLVLLITVLASVAVVVVVPSKVKADDTQCIIVPVAPPGTTTFDNVVVPPGATCLLEGAMVRGNVKALENSRLVVVDSTVFGNVEGDKADLVQVARSVVRQNIVIKEGGPAVTPPGGFECPVGTPPVFVPCIALVLDTIVTKGQVQIEKMVGTVWIEETLIESGNLSNIENNLIPLGETLFIGHNDVSQNLQVYKNMGPGEKTVAFNTANNLQCFENDPPFVGGPNDAGQAAGQCAPPAGP